MVSESAARDGYDGVVGIVTHMGDVPVDDQWPPNGCAKCGQPERGHPGGDYAYVPPPDALRLARMRARREARLNPPPSPAPTPEMFATFAADTTKLGESMQRLGEVLARTLNPLVAQMRSIAFAVGAALAEANWPAEGSTRDTLRSRDAVPVGDGEFAAWRAALNFTAATHRLLTDPGGAREEIEQAIAGIRALADNPDT